MATEEPHERTLLQTDWDQLSNQSLQNLLGWSAKIRMDISLELWVFSTLSCHTSSTNGYPWVPQHLGIRCKGSPYKMQDCALASSTLKATGTDLIYTQLKQNNTSKSQDKIPWMIQGLLHCSPQTNLPSSTTHPLSTQMQHLSEILLCCFYLGIQGFSEPLYLLKPPSFLPSLAQSFLDFLTQAQSDMAAKKEAVEHCQTTSHSWLDQFYWDCSFWRKANHIEEFLGEQLQSPPAQSLPSGQLVFLVSKTAYGLKRENWLNGLTNHSDGKGALCHPHRKRSQTFPAPKHPSPHFSHHPTLTGKEKCNSHHCMKTSKSPHSKNKPQVLLRLSATMNIMPISHSHECTKTRPGRQSKSISSSAQYVDPEKIFLASKF